MEQQKVIQLLATKPIISPSHTNNRFQTWTFSSFVLAIHLNKYNLAFLQIRLSYNTSASN